MKLNKIVVNHTGKLWCGIAALSVISGMTTQASKDTIRAAIDDMERKGRKIKGIYTDELLFALKYASFKTELRYNYWNSHRDKRISVARALHGFMPFPGRLSLIITPDHFMVTDGAFIADSLRPNGATIYDHPCSDDYCHRIYEVSEESFDNL